MNIHTTLIPATLASCVAIATCVGRVPAEEPRETIATTPDRSIALWTSVRKPTSDEDWRQIASTYSLMSTLFSPKAGGKDLTSENERVRWIKSLDPRLRVLVYGSAINTANFRLHSWKKPREHGDWFLRDEAGRYVNNPTYTNTIHLDPGNPGWQEYVAGAFEDYISRYGYDGVFVDLVGSTPYYVNYKKTKKAVNPRTGSAYTDAEWKRANLDMVRTIREHIGDKLLIVNHGRRGKSYFRTAYADFFEFADGVCFEGFAGWYRTSLTNFGKESDWKADVDALVDCAKHGKMAIAASGVKQRKEGESPEVHEQLYRYIAASFLLGADKGQYLQLSTPDILLWNNPDDSSSVLKEMFQALYNLSLGNPRGAYYRAGGVYQRDFERGKVLVNPTGQDVKLELQGTWHTDEGDPVDSPLLMPAHTGATLASQ